MQLSERDRNRFANELYYIVKQMHEKQADIFSQVYFFSAGFGITQRLLNEKWDAELSLIHLVLQTTYTGIQTRLQSIVSGNDRAVALPEGFMTALIDVTERLEGAIR